MRLLNKKSGLATMLVLAAGLSNAQIDSVKNKLPAAKADVKALKEGLQPDLKQEGKAILNSTIGQDPTGTIRKEVSTAIDPFAQKIKLLNGGKFLSATGINLHTEYTYMADTSGILTGTYKEISGIYSYSAQGTVSIAQIPFAAAIEGNNGLYTTSHTPFNDFYKFNFDPQRYKELLQKQVLAKINPEVVLGSIMTRINSIKDGYEKTLRAELSQLQENYVSEFKDQFQFPAGITDLSAEDMSGLKTKLLGNVPVEKYREELVRYQEIVRFKGQSVADTMAEARQILAGIRKYELLEKAYTKITGWKDRFENNKIVKELRSHLPFTPANFSSYLSKPGNLTEVLNKHADLNTMQQLFSKISKLDIGQNPVSNGQLNMQGMMNNGVNAAFEGKKAGAGVIAGKGNNNMNNWLQSGLNSTVTNEYSGLTGMTIGTASGRMMDQSLSVNFFNFNNASSLGRDGMFLQPSYLGSPNRQDAVITFHSGIRINDKHEIKVDLSKSIGMYKNNMTEDTSMYTKNAGSELLGSSGKSNFAAAIEYEGEWNKTDIKLGIKKVGLGYNNPGNVFLRRGETQGQWSLARKFLKQRLTVKYKGDYRDQHFDPFKNFTYTTFSNKLQASWKIKRSSRVGLSYQQSGYRSKMLTLPDNTGSNSIVQADGTYRFKLKNKQVNNSFTINHQRMNLPLLTGGDYKSNSLLIVHSSSMTLGKSVLFVTGTMNRSTSKDYYFNTSFATAESNYSYPVSGKINLTSGVGYYNNSGWNTQLGVKQQLSASLFKNMNLDLGVDWKKAIHTIRPELANQLFINASVQYRFN